MKTKKLISSISLDIMGVNFDERFSLDIYIYIFMGFTFTPSDSNVIY